MLRPKTYNNYPYWMIIISNFVSIGIYIIGAYVIFQLGLIWMVIYLAYVFVLEFRLISGHCVNCYYHGKLCAFGKGKISAVFFKKGDPKAFLRNKFTWKDMIPDILVSIIPLIVGIVLLVINFKWLILLLILLLIILTSAGNSFVRGSLACNYCKQREIGCPAERLFDKSRKK